MFEWRVALTNVDISTTSVRILQWGEIIRIEAHHCCRIIYEYIKYETNLRSSAYSVQRRGEGGYLKKLWRKAQSVWLHQTSFPVGFLRSERRRRPRQATKDQTHLGMTRRSRPLPSLAAYAFLSALAPFGYWIFMCTWNTARNQQTDWFPFTHLFFLSFFLYPPFSW